MGGVGFKMVLSSFSLLSCRELYYITGGPRDLMTHFPTIFQDDDDDDVYYAQRLSLKGTLSYYILYLQRDLVTQ